MVEPRRLRRAHHAAVATTAAGPDLDLPGARALTLEAPYGEAGRLWMARWPSGSAPLTWLAVHGRPIRYGYVERPWPIATYQNVYVTEPGSAEMPSAGRPFTPDVDHPRWWPRA